MSHTFCVCVDLQLFVYKLGWLHVHVYNVTSNEIMLQVT